MDMECNEKLNAVELRSMLGSRDFKALRTLLKDSEIADIAEHFAELDASENVALLRLVPRSRRAELFSYLEYDRQEELILELPDVILEALINEMEPDNRTKLLEELPHEIRNKILLKMNPDAREIAWQLLSYPEDSVGRLMTPEVLDLHMDLTVAEALERIQWSTALPQEYLNYLFVTESNGTLIGEVSLPSLVLCDPKSVKVSQIMKKNYVHLHPHDDGEKAVEYFRKYDTNYIPVVDDETKLIGLVTAEDIFDVAEEEATEDIQHFAAHGALENSYFQTPLFTMIRKRAGWLGFLFVSGFVSGEAIRSYEDSLTRWGFLVFFLTTLNSAGGNSGTQTASLIIRGLAINEITSKDVWKVLKKEAVVGFSLGMVLAIIGAIRAFTWGLGPQVALLISIVVITVVVLGVLAGSMLPFIFRAVKLDPAVVSSPFISTIMDLTGVLILFNVADLIMRYFGLP